MKIVNSNSILNLVNNSFVYLCGDDEGNYWLRSSAGNWVKIESSIPVDTETLDADFQKFIKSGEVVTENDVKVDNSSQVIVDPIKEEEVDITP